MNREDLRYLFRRHDVYYFRYKPKFGPEIRISLKTKSFHYAKRFRDKKVSELTAADTEIRLAKGMMANFLEAQNEASSIIRNTFPDYHQKMSRKNTLRDALAEYLIESREARRNRPEVLDQKERAVEMFIKYAKNKNVDQVTRSDLLGFLSAVQNIPLFLSRSDPLRQAEGNERKISQRSAYNIFRIVASFFKWCHISNRISSIPTSGMLVNKGPKNNTPAPPLELLDPLCHLKAPLLKGISPEEWDILPLMYRFTGARLAEIAVLRIDDIIIHKGVKCLQIPTQKRQRGLDIEDVEKRIVPIHPRLREMLMKYIKRIAPRSRLFKTIDKPYKTRDGSSMPGYGKRFGALYKVYAAAIWEPMHTHCWRAHVATCIDQTDVPESYGRYIVGHSTHGVHDDYKDFSRDRLNMKLLVKAVNAIQ